MVSGTFHLICVLFVDQPLAATIQGGRSVLDTLYLIHDSLTVDIEYLVQDLMTDDVRFRLDTHLTVDSDL